MILCFGSLVLLLTGKFRVPYCSSAFVSAAFFSCRLDANVSLFPAVYYLMPCPGFNHSKKQVSLHFRSIRDHFVMSPVTWSFHLFFLSLFFTDLKLFFSSNSHFQLFFYGVFGQHRKAITPVKWPLGKQSEQMCSVSQEFSKVWMLNNFYAAVLIYSCQELCVQHLHGC